LARKLKYPKRLVVKLKNCFDCFVRKDNQTKALQYIFEAYKISQEENLVKESMQILQGIAFAYASFNNYKEAIKYKSLELKKRLELLSDTVYRVQSNNLNADSQRIVITMSGLSFYNLKVERLDSAFYYSKRALAYAYRIRNIDSSHPAHALNCIGLAYHKAGQKKKKQKTPRCKKGFRKNDYCLTRLSK